MVATCYTNSGVTFLILFQFSITEVSYLGCKMIQVKLNAKSRNVWSEIIYENQVISMCLLYIGWIYYQKENNTKKFQDSKNQFVAYCINLILSNGSFFWIKVILSSILPCFFLLEKKLWKEIVENFMPASKPSYFSTNYSIQRHRCF